MPATKGADEMYCRSCGSVIKKKAEICPECGVRNEHGDASTGTSSRSTSHSSSRSTSSKPHDPADYQTTVSENWYYAVAGSTVAWCLLFVASAMTSSGSTLGTLAGLLGLLAWAGMPLGFYFDSEYVRANSQWNPGTGLWVLGGVIPLVSIFAGAVYLYRRHEVLGVP